MESGLDREEHNCKARWHHRRPRAATSTWHRSILLGGTVGSRTSIQVDRCHPVDMSQQEPHSGADAAAESDSAKETLSQFIARIFNQLALSAWLPAAALVLLITFIVDLGTALDSRDSEDSAVLGALRMMGDISLGGALVLFAGTVVLTMVTQAFAFEAIVVLEGYWGTNPLVEQLAQHRCTRHRRHYEGLRKRHRELTAQAWGAARSAYERQDEAQRQRGAEVETTAVILDAAGAQVLGQLFAGQVTPEERVVVNRIGAGWWRAAPPDMIRRRINLERRLIDYPAQHRIAPTILGNILRRSRDDIDVDDAQRFVQRVFDELPLSLRIEHDEQRTRLDLYCSMVFVLAFVVLVAVIRFAVHHPIYAVASVAVGSAAMLLMYRAAIVSARAYGGILRVAAEHYKAHRKPPTDGDM